MNVLTLVFALIVGSAAYWTFSIAQKPGGGAMYGALLFLAVSAAAYYGAFAFVGARPLGASTYEKGRAGALAGFFFIFAIGAAILAQQQTTVPAIISKWISMYPNITDIVHAPSVNHDFLWDFMISSDDPTDKIGHFYQDPSHTTGWKVVHDYVLHSNLANTPNAYRFEFAKPGYHLFVNVLPGRFGTGSEISYRLEDKQNHL